jgi:glycosyltransferase involved in cell wall biosynthesis
VTGVDSTKLLEQKVFETSSVCTVPQLARRVVIAGVSGGGGGGGGAEGRSGAPGFSSLWEEKEVPLVAGASYIVLLGAGAIGGASAMPGKSGEDGCSGGVSSVIGVDGLVVLVGTKSSSVNTTAPMQFRGSDTPPVPRSRRFAIVDAQTHVVDNVVIATPEFFKEELVRDLVLQRRIVIESNSLVLRTRSEPALALELHDGEKVAPGWYWTPTISASTDSRRFIEPANNPLPQVLRGIPGGRGAVRRRLADEKLHFLAVATEWRSTHGGISTINRGLCRALAADGHAVVCLVPHGTVSASDQQSASASGIHLIEAPDTSGKNLGGLSGLVRRPRLPEGFEPDIVLGHGHVTGPAAQILRQDCFPRSSCVHFIHTQPGEIEWYKDREKDPSGRAECSDRDGEQLAQASAVVVGVGPRLTRQAGMYVHGAEHPPIVEELIPALEDWSESAHATPPPEIRCLFIGRVEDRRLKGLDIAANAVARVARNPRFSPTPVLIIRGASQGSGRALQQELSVDFPHAHAVRVFEFTDDVNAVRRDFAASSVVLMPSRTEGFGLVAMEALSAGVPVLVSGQSGFAEMLKRDYPEFAGSFVIECCEQEATEKWAERILAVLSDREYFFRRVQELRQAMMSGSSWQSTVASLLTKIRLIPPE